MRFRPTEDKEEKWIGYIFVAIIILLPFHAFFTSWLANNFGHIDIFRAWKDIILVALAPIVLYRAWKDPVKKKFLQHSPIVKLFILYIFIHLLLGVAALKTHQVNKTALFYALLINLRFIGVFILAYLISFKNSFIKRHLNKIIVIPALAVIVVGIAQKFSFPQDFLWYFYGRGTIPADQSIDSNRNLLRVQSTLRGANPLGAYLVLAITSFLVFIKKSYLKALALAAAFFVLFFSYSRSAWIGTVISVWLLSWWMAFKSHHKTLLVSSFIVLVLATVGVFYVFKNRPVAQDTLLHTSSASKSPVSSNEARKNSLVDGALDVLHHPLGGGPGTAGPASFRNKLHSPKIAEDYYIQIAQEVGLLGLAIFLAINLLVADALWRQQTTTSRFLLASFIGISFVNLISHAWADDTLSLLWWSLAGICLAPALRAQSQRAPKIIKQ